MGKVLLITKLILIRMFKKPSSILLHFAMPIAVSIALFLVLNMAWESEIPVGIVDLDHSPMSAAIIDVIEETEGFTIYPYSRGTLANAVISQEVTIGLIIPRDFEEQLLSDGSPEIELVSIGDNSATNWLSGITDFQITNFIAIAKATNYDRDAFVDMLLKTDHGLVSFNHEYVTDHAKEKTATVNTFGVYMVFLLITTFTISFKILDEKRTGTFSRIAMSPVHPKSYTFANMLANILVMMIQIACVLIVLKYVLQVEFFTPIPYIFLILTVFAICGVSAGILMTAVSKTMNSANILLALVVSPTCMIAGCLFPLEYMPDYMQKIAYITPQRWTLDAIDLVQKNGSLQEAFPNLLVVIGFTTLFFLMAVYKFKNEDQLTS